jgi:hypothetical protein
MAEKGPPEFLPPEPPGPEPDLANERPGEPQRPPNQSPPQQPPPTRQPPPSQSQPPPPGQQPPPPTQPPPAQQPQPGWEPQSYGWQQQPPGWQQAPSPSGWQQQTGWQQAPPPGAQPPPPPPAFGAPAWGYPQQPPEPGNGAAVAGFITSVVAGSLMLVSFGFLAFVSVIAAPFGIFYSRRGKRAVDEGQTRKHRGLAQAGFVIGIVTLVISAIVTVLLIIFIVALATDEEFRQDFENDGGFDSTTVRAGSLAVRVAVAAIRLVA